MDELLPIQNVIYEFRGRKVMLDSDLALLYEIETKRLNEAVKRNRQRFPSDFMFQLADDEWELLRSQFATSKNGATLISQIAISKTAAQRGGRRIAPYVFTEQGVAMLSSVINSERAIAVNIQIMRVFVQIRQYAVAQNDTNEHIAELRKLLLLYIEQNDKRVDEIIKVLNDFTTHSPRKKLIGFQASQGGGV
jgi:hypothetical protein